MAVRAYPSIEEQTVMSQQEAERIAKQRNDLGEIGLKQKVDELTAAMEENCVPAPAKMLVEVPIPSTDSIQFHPVNIYRYGDEKQLECGLDLNGLPVYGEIYDLHTNFVYVSMFAYYWYRFGKTAFYQTKFLCVNGPVIKIGVKVALRQS